MGPIMDDAQFRVWKTQLVPLIYDWFSNHNLTWPTQACRWGPKLESSTYKDRYRIYLSEQTDVKTKEPPKLLVVDADICKPRVASTEVVATWTDFSKCPFVREVKAVVHPGEVNKIRELPQHPEVLVTHTDAPELYVWNIEKQPNQVRGTDKKWPAPSVAEAVLEGHVTPPEVSLFALATSNAAPRVASGGPDKLVLLWDLEDAQSGILAGQRGADNASTTRIKARISLKGHKNTVEDVVFAPGSGEELVSVGDDKQVLFWDVRTGAAPVMRIEAAHGSSSDIHCVDWNRLDTNLIATGAADGSLRVWDRRKLSGSTTHKGGAAVKVFKQHSEAIMRIEWHPTEKNVLASGGDDHLVLIWDLSRSTTKDDGAAPSKSGTESNAGAATKSDAGGSKGSGGAAAAGGASGGGKGVAPPELLFKHVGHRQGKVVDFQWCPSDPWTILSVSDDTPSDDPASPGGGKAAKGRAAAAAANAGEAAGTGADGAAAGAAAPATGAAAAAAGAVPAPGLQVAPRGGGTLQIWRVNDLIYRPEDEVIEEMEQHREWILEGINEPPRPKLPPAPAPNATASNAAGAGVKDEAAAAGGRAPSTSVGGGGDGGASSKQQQAGAGVAGDDAVAGGGVQQQRGSADGEVASQPPPLARRTPTPVNAAAAAGGGGGEGAAGMDVDGGSGGV